MARCAAVCGLLAFVLLPIALADPNEESEKTAGLQNPLRFLQEFGDTQVEELIEEFFKFVLKLLDALEELFKRVLVRRSLFGGHHPHHGHHKMRHHGGVPQQGPPPTDGSGTSLFLKFLSADQLKEILLRLQALIALVVEALAEKGVVVDPCNI
ncbi:unnamed protein product [Vitrella brassicaformis CCMP3155]|uniref:Uncharacterized protein n=1 Tax=Vitrella brassicaformis (strain CCMP3155) TaxID=1169540 RepID=A0A0G4EPE0_VITBC|nr:unnamed protein product [Vitrella brassicaformis CCMP3155]|eukprot:CEL99321.1 unnamed protein product [Vitrella brassicaformis CCMP3155]